MARTFSLTFIPCCVQMSLMTKCFVGRKFWWRILDDEYLMTKIWWPNVVMTKMHQLKSAK